MSSAASLLTPAPQIWRVSRRHCELYKLRTLNLLTYLLTDRRHTVASPRSALASRGKNRKDHEKPQGPRNIRHVVRFFQK